MNFNFELILTLAVIISGIIYLLDVVMFAPKRQQQGITHMSVVMEYSRSFFPILLIVLLLRSFLAEPYRIPSGSDEPTLLIGDFILVNKYAYGLRLPVLEKRILNIGEPKRGDIFVFRYPPDPSLNYIKRVVGLPGDTITYVDKQLYVNGKLIPQEYKGESIDQETGYSWPVYMKEENLLGTKHKIYINPQVSAQDGSWVVPPGYYFAMGDNRDDSSDSRVWGLVPEQNLVGKAVAIWFSWDSNKMGVRWSRIGSRIH